LKPDIVPQWDGDDEVLGEWLVKVSEISIRSDSVWLGLGSIVPTRFTGAAESWWYSLDSGFRRSIMMNWTTLKREIRAYWMTKEWTDRMQLKAVALFYREPAHHDETPSEYFICKKGLLSIVFRQSDENLIT
jgi:hypothetical protein